MSLFSAMKDFIDPGRKYRKAADRMDQYYKQGQQYLEPYAQQGQDAYQNLNSVMQNLLNPSQFDDQLMQDYETSDFARQQQEEAQNLGLDAASSMGLMGSTPALQGIQRGTAQIGAEDRYRALDRLIQQYMQGANTAQNIYQTGAQTAGAMSGNAMNQGQNAAQLKYGEYGAGVEQQMQLLGTLLGAMKGK